MKKPDIEILFLATYAYLLISLPLGLVWHEVLFEQPYVFFGYFDAEPNLMLVVAATAIQGVVLSLLYPLFNFGEKGTASNGLQFAMIMATCYWAFHVLSYAAHQNVSFVIMYMFFEFVYLCIQFALFGVVLGYLFSEKHPEPYLESTASE